MEISIVAKSSVFMTILCKPVQPCMFMNMHFPVQINEISVIYLLSVYQKRQKSPKCYK